MKQSKQYLFSSNAKLIRCCQAGMLKSIAALRFSLFDFLKKSFKIYIKFNTAKKCRYPFGYLHFLFAVARDSNLSKCNSPVDCCLPPVSTAATHLFLPSRQKCKSNPSSSVLNLRQQFQTEHISKQFFAEVFFRYKRIFLRRAGDVFFAGFCIRQLSFRPGNGTMPAVYTKNSSSVKGVMLQVIPTVLT